MRLIIPSILSLFLLNACMKPYACECEVNVTKVKSHTIVYASKKNIKEACTKMATDTTMVCTVLY